jgi:twinkle protein
MPNNTEKFVIGNFVEHLPCTFAGCSSSDGMAIYESGYKKCFSCHNYQYPAKGESSMTTIKTKSNKEKKPFPLNGDFRASRGVSRDTMEFMGYYMGEYPVKQEDGSYIKVAAQLLAAPFSDGKGHAATKVRLPHKDFRFVGNTQDAGFLFQDKWQAGGRKIVVTEGEYDALSIAEAQSCKYPVVSLPNGTDSVEKVFQNSYKWLNTFEEIVLWFDNDSAGIQAAEAAARFCEIGKVKIVTTPNQANDANELLKAGAFKDIINAIWQAVPYSPAGFESFSSLEEEMMAPPEYGIPWIYKEMNDWTYGRRPADVYVFGAGTGIGKTDFFLQQAAADIENGEKVSVFSFEQAPKETGIRLAGKQGKRQFHIPDSGWTDEEKLAAIKALGKTDCLIYKHFGSAEWEPVAEDITALAHQGYKHFYIDHLTAFAASAVDEKKMLETVMAQMSGLAQRLGVIFYIISHLSTPDGTPHEEGGRVFIKHFKGSRAIGYWAHFMFAFERDTQAEDMDLRLRSKLRCLKDRYTGRGNGQWLTQVYDPATGMQSVDSEWKWETGEKKKGKSGSDHGFSSQDKNDDF